MSSNGSHEETVDPRPQVEMEEQDMVCEEQQSGALMPSPLTKENLRAAMGEPLSSEEPYTEPFPEATPQSSRKAGKEDKRKKRKLVLNCLKTFIPDPILKTCRKAMYVPWYQKKRCVACRLIVTLGASETRETRRQQRRTRPIRVPDVSKSTSRVQFKSSHLRRGTIFQCLFERIHDRT